MAQTFELIGECKGNDGNGCFMDNSAHSCGCFVKKPKQQTTLIEAANKYSKILSEVVAFYMGAKWQQERMYSEEDVLKMLLIKHDGLTPEYVLQLCKNNNNGTNISRMDLS